MFLPYSDDAPKKTFAPVTHGLILLQAIATWLVMTDPNPEHWLLDPKAPTLLSWIGHLFAHAGLAHFCGNALVLHLVGRPLEHRLGRARFLGLYFVAAIVADVTLMLATPAPALGASGAISGLIGAYVFLFFDASISVAYTVGPFIGFMIASIARVRGSDGIVEIAFAGLILAFFQAWTLRRDLSWSETFLGLFGAGRFEVRAYWLVGFWAFFQILGAWLQVKLGASDGVGYWAHLGGLVLGLGFGVAALLFPALAPAPAEEPETTTTPAPATRAIPTRSTLRLGFKRELTSLLEKGAGQSVAALYAQAVELDARPVLTPELQEQLATILGVLGEKTLERHAVADLVSVHGTSPEGQRAFGELRGAARPATRRLGRPHSLGQLVESTAA